MKRVEWVAVILLIAVLGCGGCRQEPEGWTPVLEQTSTKFLRTQVEEAREDTLAARRMVPDEPLRAIEKLDEAALVLDELLDFYLPIFEARELTYNAYRELYLGRPAQSLRALDEVESILEQVAKRDRRYHRAVQTPREHTEKAKLALETDSLDAQEALNVLAKELNFIALKGEMMLTDG